MATIPDAFNLAFQHHQAGRLSEAEALYRQILQEHPNHADALHLLGLIAHQVGRHEAAVELIGKAIAVNPNVAEYHNNLGEACRVLGNREEAIGCYRRALELQPDYAAPCLNLGVVFHEQGKPEEAISQFQQALTRNPTYAEALNGLGVALARLGRLEEAQEPLRRAVALNPAYAEAYNNLGTVLKRAGKLDEAAATYRQALSLRPAYAEAFNNLGLALHEMVRLDEAVDSYGQAIALKPDFAEALVNKGRALIMQGKPEEGVDCYRQALKLRPDDDGLRIKVAIALPVILQSKAHLREVRQRFAEQVSGLLERKMKLVDPVSEVDATAMGLAYHGENDRELQVKLARLYERACPSLLYIAPHCVSSARSKKNNKIKIGFISKFLKTHSIGKTFRGVFAQLSRERFCTYALYVPPVAHDDVSVSIQRHADKVIFVPVELQAARARIAAEELDILFYLDIGMDPFTYFLAFSRLAPVQCLSFGHPVTSGIKNIDYFISTEGFEPDKGEKHYSERLIRLKSSIAYYYKPEVPTLIKPRSAFGLKETDHVYLCPQNLFKFHPDFDEILSGILDADPQARLVLKRGNASRWATLLLERFNRTMPRVLDRVMVLPPQPGDDFINLMAVSDVMLDTIHFGGFNTSMEAFAVGTPVVTWPGKFQRSRHTAALYRSMGFGDCVADSPASYVKIAVRLGMDEKYRQRIKAKIRGRNDRLYEDLRVVKEYERVFLQMMKDVGRSR